ncbi:AAA family ATPase [Cytobacillus oceanisediminis]|uniref:AAA family ATPase n=1 Tax=Cytobacillus oceanisediminis TaxID=665099 RepID=UPI0037C15259
MSKEDTILIKIGVSYREGMTPEELYHATSVSWVIGENRLRSGDLKYFCAVYNNEIKEIYNLSDYEKDNHPDNKGRFILLGEIAEDPVRYKLLDLNVRDIHRGSGNPIKYVKMEDLLSKANNDDQGETETPDNSMKSIFMSIVKNKSEIRTLSTNKPIWITNFNEEEILVETESSRERFSQGEEQKPYAAITYDYLLTAWEEFLNVRIASPNDFIKTNSRSGFIMSFFHELPFVDKVISNNILYIKLKEFTTDQLPEASLEQTMQLLNDIINQDIDPKEISQKYKEDSIKRLKLRARQGLKLLGFLNGEYQIQQSILNGYIDAVNKNEYLSKLMLHHPYFLVIYQTLSLLKGINKTDKLSLLSEIGMIIVRNSKGSNLMEPSVSQYRTRNILNWLRETGLVNEEWDVLDDKLDAKYTLSSSPSMVREDKSKIFSLNEIIEHINQYIASKGFYYPKEEVINLFLSLKSKPFVILSGISGTGKTKMVQWFAESLGATEKNGQYTLIPVRPDWSDGSDLLGYVDIKGDFKEGPLTKAIKAAQEHPELPYFVLLDEMNLARVEYYFSDILSVMESRKWEEGKVVSSTLLSEEVAKEEVTLPNNLYVIGTVNMDETTHPFSKKVLDRANTIEFNRVELDNLSFLHDLEEVDSLVIGQSQLASKYLHLKDLYKVDTEIIEKATSELIRINKSLQLINAHIGYRVRDEICFYLAYNKEGDLMTFEEAFDHCILQKILPRLSGSDSRIEQLLRELYLLFTNTEYQEDEESQFDEQSAIYPKSARKVIEMLRRLQADGFTSFWIS